MSHSGPSSAPEHDVQDPSPLRRREEPSQEERRAIVRRDLARALHLLGFDLPLRDAPFEAPAENPISEKDDFSQLDRAAGS